MLDASGRMLDQDKSWLVSMMQQSGSILQAAGDFRIRVVADAEMAQAHEEFTGISGTTDVLTFDLTEIEGDRANLDIDVLICIDEADRQAKVRTHEPRAELLLYCIHGLLHCLGHDDHDEQAAARMHAEEDRILIALGVGPVYARNAAPPPGLAS